MDDKMEGDNKGKMEIDKEEEGDWSVDWGEVMAYFQDLLSKATMDQLNLTAYQRKCLNNGLILISNIIGTDNCAMLVADIIEIIEKNNKREFDEEKEIIDKMINCEIKK